VAQRIGHFTPLPSLELSVEPVTNGVDTNVGFTRLYGSHISWSSPTTPVTREINPQLAFDRLFRSNLGGRKASPHDQSVLDAVSQDAKSLRSKVGAADRLKLEESFDSVRAVEKRIAFDAARRQSEHREDPLARAEIEKLGSRIKSFYEDPSRLGERGIDHTEQVRLMLDNCMVVLGSGMKDGNSHNPHDLPILLAGRVGGTLATGRHLSFEKSTPLCNLYRSMLGRMGTPQSAFGDSTGELPGLGDAAFQGVIAKA
jgi:hypothetical protein